MIVFFSGAQGVGKTQTIELVSKKLGCVVVPSVSSSAWQEYFARAGLPKDTKWSELDSHHQSRYQLYVAAKAIELMIEYREKKGIYLFDRSLLDVLSFTLVKKRSGTIDDITYTTITSLYKSCFLSFPTITFFFRPDPDYPVEDKGNMRVVSNQGEVDLCFDTIAEYSSEIYNGIDILRVPDGSIEEKADFCIKKITNSLL